MSCVLRDSVYLVFAVSASVGTKYHFSLSHTKRRPGNLFCHLSFRQKVNCVFRSYSFSKLYPNTTVCCVHHKILVCSSKNDSGSRVRGSTYIYIYISRSFQHYQTTSLPWATTKKLVSIFVIRAREMRTSCHFMCVTPPPGRKK